ncbi:uncharacterized protein LOC101862991, partial [Aplysia californica]|uniref:Uncharacterized protein LOC101862991 n=1 Tax=Aplysia californica TaxID=6500 RepID=A0ABM1AED4_APLCA
MTKVELEILQGTLRTLRAQSCKALSQMKFLFPCNRPPEGIDLLLSVLQLSLKLMSYLCPSSQNSFESCLKAIVQGMFKPCYEMFRTVAIGDLGQGRNATLDPRLLNILIQDIREDVSDYKNHFESTFQRYFSISKMAASTFYQLLMNDVHALTETDPRHKPLVEIDLRMLALGYRLKQLDSDWKMYITPQQQTWRAAFQGSLTQWTSA